MFDHHVERKALQRYREGQAHQKRITRTMIKLIGYWAALAVAATLFAVALLGGAL